MRCIRVTAQYAGICWKCKMKIALGEEIVWSTEGPAAAYHEACMPADAEFSSGLPIGQSAPLAGGFVTDGASAGTNWPRVELFDRVKHRLSVVLAAFPGVEWHVDGERAVEVAIDGYRERIPLANIRREGTFDVGNDICLTPDDLARLVARRVATALAEMALERASWITRADTFHQHELERLLADHPLMSTVQCPWAGEDNRLTVWTKAAGNGPHRLFVIPLEDELGWTVVPNTEGARGTRCAHLYAVATVAREWLDSL